ncbi:MAG TPA: methyltransferase domain-containing protein [Terriglobales bacterium]|nr:methyltransferase domain-containing protein [Terriglobales bacterium]
MDRVPTTELLDHDAGSAEEVATALADLRRINRWFGGIGTTMAMIRQVVRSTGKANLSWLEIAAASGDVPQSARDRLARAGIRLEVTLLDRAPSHLVKANPAVVADGLALPFRDGSFDLVGCGLFAHHLAPEPLVRFADESLRVARLAVLINDLVRHPLHLVAVYAGMPLYRGRLTRHDGPASVRQAYTVEEMRAMLVRTQAGRVEIARHYLFRMGAILWKG